MFAPGTRPSRTLAVLLLLVMGGLVYLGAVGPYLEERRRLEMLSGDYADLLARFRGATRDGPAVERQLAGLQEAAGDGDARLPGGSPGVAAARLQDRIKAIIQASGATLRQVQALPARPAPMGTQVGARVTLTASVSELLQIVHAAETGRPLLFLDALDVRRAGTDDGAVSLNVRFDAVAYMSEDGT